MSVEALGLAKRLHEVAHAALRAAKAVQDRNHKDWDADEAVTRLSSVRDLCDELIIELMRINK